MPALPRDLARFYPLESLKAIDLDDNANLAPALTAQDFRWSRAHARACGALGYTRVR